MSAGDPGRLRTRGPPLRHRLHPLTLAANIARCTAKMEPARVSSRTGHLRPRAVQGTFYTEIAVDHLGIGSLIEAALFGASALGLTFYAGMLERLVGSVERGEPAQPVFTVLRTLPWGRLLVAEAILIVFSAVASVALSCRG